MANETAIHQRRVSIPSVAVADFARQIFERFDDKRTLAIGPMVRQLRRDWERLKDEETQRLFHKLPQLDERTRGEIGESFERLLNKLLRPPLESLRDECRRGIPGTLLDALARLFQVQA